MHIKVKSGFSAAHHIEGHSKCGETHGHNFVVWLTVSVTDSGKQIELDFDDLKIILDNICKNYDHKNIGNKSSEELVREISEKLKDKLKFKEVEKFKVGVYESENFGVDGEWISIKT